MLKTAISNHPHFAGVTRVADVASLHYNHKEIKLELIIDHFIDGNKIGDMTKRIDLMLDNTKTYSIGGNTIGDYDAFVAQAENDGVFKPMVQAGIWAVDLDGTINAKCAYQSSIVE